MVQCELVNGNHEFFELHALDTGGRMTIGNRTRPLNQREWEQLHAILGLAVESERADR